MSKQPRKGHRLRYGEGTFRWHESRQLWVGRLEAGTDHAGKRRQVQVTGRDEDRAWDKLMVKRKALMTEGAAAALQRDITVKAWMPQWLDVTAASLRPRSQRAATSYVTKWIIPTLGGRKLQDLTASDARRLVKAVLDAERSSTTAGKILETLQSALTRARAEGYTVPEPVLLVKKPRAAAMKRSAIPVNDALRLIQHVVTKPDAARWVAALLQGMRQGECLGLTWDCVDLQRGELDVSWQLQALPYLDRQAETFRVPHGYETRRLDGGYHLVRPKTAAGQRVIPLVPWLAESLHVWREVGPVSRHGLVWPRADGRPQTDVADRKAWYALQAEAEVSKADGGHYVLHEARHTSATLLLMAGVSPSVIQAIMGHSDILTQEAYLHAPRALLLTALEGVASTLQLGSPRPPD